MSKRPRIGVNARMLLPHRMEGISRYIFETTKRIVLSHPEYDFYFFFDRNYDQKYIFADNVYPVVVAPQSRHPYLWYLWFEWSLPYYLNKYKIDQLYSGDGYISVRSKVPTLLVVHDLAYIHYPNHVASTVYKFYKKYNPKYLAKAKHIISVSKATKNDIIKHFKVDPDKITIGHNATPQGFKKLNIQEKKNQQSLLSEGDPYFMYLGSLHPRKNVEGVIKAFDHYKTQHPNTHFKLLITGRKAWMTGDIDRTYQNATFKNDIVFKELDRKSLHLALGAAEALIYISHFEGFGIPILEGFSSEIPVITSNISSMPEVAGDAALLVNPKDYKAAASAMHSISSNQTLRQELITKGLARMKLFSWESTSNIIWEKLIG